MNKLNLMELIFMSGKQSIESLREHLEKYLDTSDLSDEEVYKIHEREMIEQSNK